MDCQGIPHGYLEKKSFCNCGKIFLTLWLRLIVETIFEVYSSMALNTSTLLYDHQHHPSLELSHLAKRKLYTHYNCGCSCYCCCCCFLSSGNPEPFSISVRLESCCQAPGSVPPPPRPRPPISSAPTAGAIQGLRVDSAGVLGVSGSPVTLSLLL